MSFSESISHVFSNYATFSGRASRSEYWYFVLFQFIIGAAFGIIGVIFGGDDGHMPGWVNVLTSLYGLATLLPSLAVSVRRLHDTGRGGGWIFIALIPVIGQIWFIVLTILPGQPGANRFGTAPY